MSDIVNVGIQQGGIEDRSPEAVSAEGYQLVETFMDSGQRKLLEASYELVQPSSAAPNGRPWSEQYPAAAADGFYVLRADIDADTRLALDTAFGRAAGTMMLVFQEFSRNGAENLGIDLPAESLALMASEGDISSVDPAGIPAEETGDALVSSEGIIVSGESPIVGGEGSFVSGEIPIGGGENPIGGGEGPIAGDDGPAGDSQSIDFTAIYEVLPLVKLIPPERMAIFQAQAAEIDDLMLSESATMLIGSYYRELGVDMNDLEMSYIVRIGMYMLLITLTGGIATVLVSLCSSRAGAGLARNLRSAVFKKVLAFSHTEFDRFSTASLITRSTNDVTQMQNALTMGVRMLFYAPIMGLGAVIMALRTSVGMSWIIGLAVLFLLALSGVFLFIIMPKFRVIQKLIDRLNLVAREALNGQMVIRAFSRERFEEERFDVANVDVMHINLFIQRALVFTMPAMMVFMNLLTVLIIWIGAEQVAASQMQVGDMMAYMQYAMMMMMSFMFITMAFFVIPRAMVSAGRIADVLEAVPVISDPEDPVVLPTDLPAALRGRVELKDVSFRFEGAEADALRHIDFVAEAGSTTAIIGSTGSGKSSILNLIPRFYDVASGEVLFDGVDVRDLSTHDLRCRIGYVPQKSLLMSGTVAENIVYGNPFLEPEEIEQVTEVAQALDFVTKLEAEVLADADALEMEGWPPGGPGGGPPGGMPGGRPPGGGPPGGMPGGPPGGGHPGGPPGGTGGGPPSGGPPGGMPGGPPGGGMPYIKTQYELEHEPDYEALLPGFSFELAQGGSNISGGQKQRLAIARALAVKPEVFLFDDSFSALDFATDAALRKALANYLHDATLIIVAQRVGTIMDADSIYVLDKGAVIGKGTHRELLQTCAAYREIAESQLSPEELEASMGGDAQ